MASGEFELKVLEALDANVRVQRDVAERLRSVEQGVSTLTSVVSGLAPRVGAIESREAAEAIDHEVISDRATPGDPSLLGKVVLLAEDEPALRGAIVKYLEAHGAEVIQVSSAMEGRSATAHRTELHAAIIDYHLRCIERGVGLATWVRERWPRCRILVTSGDDAGLVADSEVIGRIGAWVAKKPQILEPMKAMLEDGSSARGARRGGPPGSA